MATTTQSKLLPYLPRENNYQVKDPLLLLSHDLLWMHLFRSHSIFSHMQTLRHWNKFPVSCHCVLLFEFKKKKDLKDYQIKNIQSLEQILLLSSQLLYISYHKVRLSNTFGCFPKHPDIFYTKCESCRHCFQGLGQSRWSKE